MFETEKALKNINDSNELLNAINIKKNLIENKRKELIEVSFFFFSFNFFIYKIKNELIYYKILVALCASSF